MIKRLFCYLSAVITAVLLTQTSALAEPAAAPARPALRHPAGAARLLPAASGQPKPPATAGGPLDLQRVPPARPGPRRSLDPAGALGPGPPATTTAGTATTGDAAQRQPERGGPAGGGAAADRHRTAMTATP